VPTLTDKKHGYYICNRKEFLSKVDACLYSQLNNKPVRWNFLDDHFGVYDWTVEPEVTLDELYDQRARELREQYDYIILSYSGGSDSHNMVESFIRQGLHIDEILTNHLSTVANKTTVLDPTVTDTTNFHAEHDLQAMPRLRELHHRIPRTKITVLDMSQSLIESMKATFVDETWALHGSDHLSMSYQFRTNYMYFAELKKQFDKGKSIGFVLGSDKPNTYLMDNSLYLDFSDRVANLPNLAQHNIDYENISLEFFYWASTTAPMICKQTHVIRRWVEHASEEHKALWRRRDMAAWRSYKEKITRGLIYTTWNDEWFQTTKGSVWWNTQYDLWAHSTPELEQVRNNWKRGLSHVVKLIPSYVQYTKDGVPDALKVFSRSYFIGNIAPLITI